MPKLPITKYSLLRHENVGVEKFFQLLSGLSSTHFLALEEDVWVSVFMALVAIEQGNVSYPLDALPGFGGSCTVTNDPKWPSGQSQLNVDAVPSDWPPCGIVSVGGEACYYYARDATHLFVNPFAGTSGRNYPFGGGGVDHPKGETITYTCPFVTLVGSHEFQVSPPGSKKGGVFMPILMRYLADKFSPKRRRTPPLPNPIPGPPPGPRPGPAPGPDPAPDPRPRPSPGPAPAPAIADETEMNRRAGGGFLML